MAVIITAKDIKKAKSYVPIANKEAFCRLAANFCVEKVAVHTDLGTAPDLWRENRMRRQQFMMGVLAEMYLGAKIKKQKVQITDEKNKTVTRELSCLMDFDMFDDWAGSHVLNQIERLKRCKDALAKPKSGADTVADKVFNILYDYKGFEIMLCGAIKDLLAVKNDTCSRFYDMMQSATNPEDVAAAIEELSKLKAEVEQHE